MSSLEIILVFLYFFIYIFKYGTSMDQLKINTTEEMDLFEGDLKIPVKLILQHYNFSSMPGGNEVLQEYFGNVSDISKKHFRMRRSARTTSHLWENRTIRYRISATTTRHIHAAIQSFQDTTCLRFVEDNHAEDYIDFVDSDENCFSSFIGRQGGRQAINLRSPACDSVGQVIHLIAHAVGLWHEQSRPDRDSYITVFWSNIDQSKVGEFLKRNNYEVDYQGTDYDYGSLMHSPVTASQRTGCSGTGCVTMAVNNASEYLRQGQPILGSRNDSLSATDTLQINRMYSCPGRGNQGFLSVSVKSGISLGDDSTVNPNSYVKITAVDSDGIAHDFQTNQQPGTQFPVWNEHFLLGYRNWQFFRVSAHGNEQLTMSQTVIMQHNRSRQNVMNCKNTECTGFVIFDYYLDSRIIESAELRVTIRYAQNLLRTDRRNGVPNLYVRIQANQRNLVSVTRRTDSSHSNAHPVWDNESINFGCGQWVSIIIQIVDANLGNAMSEKELVHISYGQHSNVHHPAHSNWLLVYDYRLTVDRNGCFPYPCQNSGTCHDGCNSYTCSCLPFYGGSRCQSAIGELLVVANYARNLPNRDGFLDESDPYMEFIAIDENGNRVRRTTKVVQNSNRPTWNEFFLLGNRIWKSLLVRVYDADIGNDDPLSRQETFNLTPRSRIGYHVRHNCYSGWAVLSYTF